VSVGLHAGATAKDLELASAALRAGARFITPNRDATYPDASELVAGTGAAVAALESASRVRADVVGKPERHLIVAAMQHAAVKPAQTVMIGDSLATDIASANAAGVRSILMLTGTTTSAEALEAQRSRSAPRPDRVARDAVELAAILAEFRAA